MMLIFTPTGSPARINMDQDHESGSCVVGFVARLDTSFGALRKLDGSKHLQRADVPVWIYRRSQRLGKAESEFEFAGAMEYSPSREPDAEIPGATEGYFLQLLADDGVFDEITRLSALGHVPVVTVTLRGSVSAFGDRKAEEHGLSYAEGFSTDYVWDTENYPSIAVEEFRLNFVVAPAPASRPELEDDAAEIAANALPATRLQAALLIETVRYVGIGLGILLIVLHYLH